MYQVLNTRTYVLCIYPIPFVQCHNNSSNNAILNQPGHSQFTPMCYLGIDSWTSADVSIFLILVQVHHHGSAKVICMLVSPGNAALAPHICRVTWNLLRCWQKVWPLQPRIKSYEKDRIFILEELGATVRVSRVYMTSICIYMYSNRANKIFYRKTVAQAACVLQWYSYLILVLYYVVYRPFLSFTYHNRSVSKRHYHQLHAQHSRAFDTPQYIYINNIYIYLYKYIIYIYIYIYIYIPGL